MRRTLILLVGVLVAAVPATVGLMGNASFAERLPVRSPSATASAGPTVPAGPTATVDDKGDRRPAGVSDDPATHDANDDTGGQSSGSGSGDDSGHDSGDDHGGESGSGGHGSDD